MCPTDDFAENAYNPLNSTPGLEEFVEPFSMLEGFVHQKTVLLTTHRRNGDPVATPVNIAVEGDRAFIRTYDKYGKARRIRNNPFVQFAHCAMRGQSSVSPTRFKAMIIGHDDVV